MKKTLFVLVASSAFALALASQATDAHAEPPVASASTAVAPPVAVASTEATDVASRDRVPVASAESDMKHVALTLNPLSLALTRIGINAELLPARHHAILLNPYFQSLSIGSDGNKTSYSNFGGEVGYRFYTGSTGANGFFVGPSLLFQHSAGTATSTSSSGVTSESSVSVNSYGAAVDLGGQHVFDNGFTIGGGIGLMYLASSATANAQTSSTMKFEGVLPRFLFTVGWSF